MRIISHFTPAQIFYEQQTHNKIRKNYKFDNKKKIIHINNDKILKLYENKAKSIKVF